MVWICEARMAKSPRKQRLSVYLDPKVMSRLAEHAARRDLSRSLVAEAANGDSIGEAAIAEPPIAARLDQRRPPPGQAGARYRHRRRDTGGVRPLLAGDNAGVARARRRRPPMPRLASAMMPSSPRSAGAWRKVQSFDRKSPRTSKAAWTHSSPERPRAKWTGGQDMPTISECCNDMLS